MEQLSLVLTLLLVALIAVLIYLIITVIKAIKKREDPAPAPKSRDPKTFVRSVNRDPATNRWQLTCLPRIGNPAGDNPDFQDGAEKDYQFKANEEKLPEVDRCVTDDNQIAPTLIVRANDVVVYDFTGNTTNDFAWIDFQFPEPDLFVGLGGLPNSFDDYIVRAFPGQILTLRVRDRKPCDNIGPSNRERFVYAMYVADFESKDANPPRVGYVQGGSPTEIEMEYL